MINKNIKDQIAENNRNINEKNLNKFFSNKEINACMLEKDEPCCT